MKSLPIPRRRTRAAAHSASPKPSLKLADEVWIATALLHREHPDRPDFTVNEIVARVRREALTDKLRPGVRTYVLLHCVANYTANPARYRGLFATSKETRRLFREGDDYHPSRRDAKFMPRRDQIPAPYHALLDWYRSVYAGEQRRDPTDSILAMSGLGKELWANEDPDEYVRRLREDWD